MDSVQIPSISLLLEHYDAAFLLKDTWNKLACSQSPFPLVADILTSFGLHCGQPTSLINHLIIEIYGFVRFFNINEKSNSCAHLININQSTR